MHEGHRERMRERYLQNGIDAFAPHEVLEMLLYFSKPRVNTNGTAHMLLEKFGSFSSVLDADFETLCKTEGIGTNSAFFLCLLKDSFNLYTKSKWKEKYPLTNSATAGAYIVDMIGEQSTEGFYLLCMDSARNVLSMNKLFSGTAYRTFIDVRLVVENALSHRAHSVIFAHNHPSGPIYPSDADIALTRRLQKTFQELEIPVIDHIIVGEGCYYSMADHTQM